MVECPIHSLDDPRLDPYRSLKRTNLNRHSDFLVAEGVTVVQRLLQSQFEVASVLVTDGKWDGFRSQIPAQVPVFRLSNQLASQLVGYKFHMGVLAAAHRQQPGEPSSVLAATGQSLIFAADQVIDQQNIGLLVRIAAGFGADALLCTPGAADPFSRRAIRVSTGNCFFLPIIEATPKTFLELSRAGYACCASVLDVEAVDLRTFRFPERTVLVFGNETHGIGDSLRAVCQHNISIPMWNGTDSLNVAIAAGIFGFAYRMQYTQGT